MSCYSVTTYIYVPIVYRHTDGSAMFLYTDYIYVPILLRPTGEVAIFFSI